MARNTVEVELKLKGQITRAYNRVRATIGKDNSKIRASIAKTASKTKESFSQTQKSISSAGQGVKDFAKRFGPAAIAVTVLTAAVSSMNRAIDFVNQKSKEFEKTMSSVKAILKPTTAEFAELSEEARRLGETTAFSASEVGTAFKELGKLGFNTNQILAASADVLNLAAGAEIELARAAELTALTLTQFNLDASEAQRVTDVMGKSFNISALDAEKFGEAMKFAGPVAAQLGTQVEEATAAIATLAQSGVAGTMAGTAMRRIMLELGDSSSKAARLINRADFATLSFTEKLEALQKKNLSPSTIKKTFGLLSATSAGILIKGTENIKKFNKELDNAEGTMKGMADTMLDNVAGAEKILESATEGLGLALGEAFGPAKRERIEFYTRLVNRATDIVKGHREELASVANFLSTIFMSSIKIIATSFKGWLGILGIIEEAFWRVLNAGSSALLSLAELANKASGIFGKQAVSTEFLDTLKFSIEDIDKTIVDVGNRTFNLFQPLEESAKKAKQEVGKLKNAGFVPGVDIETGGGKGKRTQAKAEADAFAQGASARKKFLDEAKAQRDKDIEAAKKAQSELELMSLSGFDRQLAELKNFETEKRDILQKAGEDTIALEKVIAQRKTAIDKARFEERKQNMLNIAAFSLNSGQTLTNALANLASVRGQNDIKAAEKAGASEEKLLSVRKKAFETQKKYSIAQALINTALAITSALATVPFVPLGAIAAGIAALAGGIQVAAIKKQKFQRGAGSGAVQGNSHSGDHVNVKANSGEVFLTKSDQRRLLDLATGRNSGGAGTNVVFEAPIIQVQAGSDIAAIQDAVGQTYEESVMKFSEFQNDVNLQESVAS